jgi:hypothetical protein
VNVPVVVGNLVVDNLRELAVRMAVEVDILLEVVDVLLEAHSHTAAAAAGADMEDLKSKLAKHVFYDSYGPAL